MEESNNQAAPRKKRRKKRDILGIATLVITLVFGTWGGCLSLKMIDLSNAQLALSRKQDTTSIDLQHFSKLLDKTDTILNYTRIELDTMTGQYKLVGHTLNVLDRQLAINQLTQAQSNHIYALIRQQNINKLTNAGIELFEIRVHPEGQRWINISDVINKQNVYVHNMKIILQSQSENSFLLENDSLSKRWFGLLNGISSHGDIDTGKYIDWHEKWFQSVVNEQMTLAGDISNFCEQTRVADLDNMMTMEIKNTPINTQRHVTTKFMNAVLNRIKNKNAINNVVVKSTPYDGESLAFRAEMLLKLRQNGYGVRYCDGDKLWNEMMVAGLFTKPLQTAFDTSIILPGLYYFGDIPDTGYIIVIYPHLTNTKK